MFGALRGFDRVRFRGTVRQLATVSGMMSVSKVLLKDFGTFANQATRRFRANPLDDIRHTRRIELVIRGGIVCRPAELLKLVPKD